MQKKNSNFERKGGVDSTTSDIAVIKNNKVDFYIEAKDSPAQSGQFVVEPDNSTKTFIFSKKNHSKPNELTNIIIEYMSNNFERYYNAGTSGQPLEINKDIFAGWIINYYKNKKVKYFISYDREYVILPIRKFAAYFDIFANYRIKKSGSRNPAKKDISAIKNLIHNLYPSASFSYDNGKLFVYIKEPLKNKIFEYGNFRYFFSTRNQLPQHYRITKLSNTYHMNVIFSIKLKKSQDEDDLDEFESDL